MKMGTTVLLGGGSTPPSDKMKILGGGSTPPSSKVKILGGGPSGEGVQGESPGGVRGGAPLGGKMPPTGPLRAKKCYTQPCKVSVPGQPEPTMCIRSVV